MLSASPAIGDSPQIVGQQDTELGARSPELGTMRVTFEAASPLDVSTSHRLGIDWIHSEITGFMFIKQVHERSEAAKYPNSAAGCSCYG